jgi:hypothetical protein
MICFGRIHGHQLCVIGCWSATSPCSGRLIAQFCADEIAMPDSRSRTYRRLLARRQPAGTMGSDRIRIRPPHDGDDRAWFQVVGDRWQVRREQRCLLVGREAVGGAEKDDRGSRRPVGCGQELAEIAISGDDHQALAAA